MWHVLTVILVMEVTAILYKDSDDKDVEGDLVKVWGASYYTQRKQQFSRYLHTTKFRTWTLIYTYQLISSRHLSCFHTQKSMMGQLCTVPTHITPPHDASCNFCFRSIKDKTVIYFTFPSNDYRAITGV